MCKDKPLYSLGVFMGGQPTSFFVSVLFPISIVSFFYNLLSFLDCFPFHIFPDEGFWRHFKPVFLLASPPLLFSFFFEVADLSLSPFGVFDVRMLVTGDLPVSPLFPTIA